MGNSTRRYFSNFGLTLAHKKFTLRSMIKSHTDDKEVIN